MLQKHNKTMEDLSTQKKKKRVLTRNRTEGVEHKFPDMSWPHLWLAMSTSRTCVCVSREKSSCWHPGKYPFFFVLVERFIDLPLFCCVFGASG